jgi:hypothetical protein
VFKCTDHYVNRRCGRGLGIGQPLQRQAAGQTGQQVLPFEDVQRLCGKPEFVIRVYCHHVNRDPSSLQRLEQHVVNAGDAFASGQRLVGAARQVILRRVGHISEHGLVLAGSPRDAGAGG